MLELDRVLVLLDRLLDELTECVLELLLLSSPRLDEEPESVLLIDEVLDDELLLLDDRLLLIEEVLLLVEIDMLELESVLALDVDIDETDWLLAVLDEALLVLAVDSLVALDRLVFECVLDELLRLLELDRECVLLLVETLWLVLLLSDEVLDEELLSELAVLLDCELSVLPSKE